MTQHPREITRDEQIENALRLMREAREQGWGKVVEGIRASLPALTTPPAPVVASPLATTAVDDSGGPSGSDNADLCMLRGPLADVMAMSAVAGNDRVLQLHFKRSEPMAELTNAALDVLAERRRQVEVEDFDGLHDDMATRGQLAAAALGYVQSALSRIGRPPSPLRGLPALWPWDAKWWKPTTPRRDLVKAGALILAEIERLDRAAVLPPAQEPK